LLVVQEEMFRCGFLALLIDFYKKLFLPPIPSMRLNEQQSEVLKMLKVFARDSAKQFFILRGYAGTGKTTLVSHFIQWLTEKELGYELLATTGRAAKILKDKTGLRTTTIHSAIYSFSDIEGELDQVKQVAGSDLFGQLSLVFGTREPLDSEKQPILIIDEASMLSNVPDNSLSYMRFGSGKLLDDLMLYANGAKVIFVGDPCQLPPVGSLASVALDKEWLDEHYESGVSIAELTQIMRQGEDSGIMHLAGVLRNWTEQAPADKYPKLPVRRKLQMSIHASEQAFVRAYVALIKEKGHQEAICIARTNRECLMINKAVRNYLHGNEGPVRVGDILMVTQNNYLSDIVNGDLVKVCALKARDMKIDIPFLKIEVENLYSKERHELWMVESLLESPEPNLNKEQHRALMIDFSNRMMQQNIGRKSKKFKIEMLRDPYLNALRAQYGYAVTCHKSQGGEWPQIFLFIDHKMYGMDRTEGKTREQQMRWLYTAVTRAEHHLHFFEGWWLG
jgi:ATP-dependent exoDNAse (exonuclease V) alpha subunit